MKKLITIVLLLAVTLSCSDTKKNKISNGNKIDQTQNDSFLSAKVDGTAFYSVTLNYFSAQNIITFAAVSKDETEKIRIYVAYKKGPATYTFGKGISNVDNMIYTNNSGDWLAAKTKGKGIITFTEEGNYLKGVFSFTGISKDNKSTKQITDGKFKVRIKP